MMRLSPSALTLLVCASASADPVACTDDAQCNAEAGVAQGYQCSNGCCMGAPRIKCMGTGAGECALLAGETCDGGACQCTGKPSTTSTYQFCPCAQTAQSITPCACKSGTVSCTSGKCQCNADGLQPTLRLVAEYTSGISNITYHPLEGNGLALPGLSAAQVRAQVELAAARWSDVQCCPGVKSPLRLVAQPGGGTAQPVGGEPSYNVIEGTGPDGQFPAGRTQPDVIKRISPDGNGELDDGVLATTINAIGGTMIYRSRMVINNHDYTWRIGACNGCAPNNYDVATVLTHEFGHFVGYQHSSCSKSIMYPQFPHTAAQAYLDPADQQALCELDTTYPNTGYAPAGLASCTGFIAGQNAPTNTNTTLQPRHGDCTQSVQCSPPLKCSSQQSCELECTSNANCQAGEVCDWQLGGKTYCRIRDATSGGPSGQTAISSDFCGPCEKAADCLQGVCVSLSNGAKICSGHCSNNSACGDAGTCTAASNGEGYCLPKDTSCIQTAVDARAALNEACSEDHQCGPNLSCVQLVNAAVCLERCGANRQCTTQGYDCYETNAETKEGVCFKAIMREGESCLLPDQALCGFSGNLACFFTDATGSQAACYRLCGGPYGDPCVDGQTCRTDTGVVIGACQPLVAVQTYAIGTRCANDEECATGYCAGNRGEQGCSRRCDAGLQSGCPEGFRCDPVPGATDGVCWPKNNVLLDAPAKAAENKGCGCHGSDPTGVLLLLAGVLFVLRRRALAALVVLLLAGNASATTMVAVDGPTLAALSDTIVHARVLAVQGRVTPQARVYTEAMLEVIEGLKGAERGTRINVTYAGGRTPQLGMHVAGQVSLRESSEVILYLRKTPEGYTPSAMRQGFYDITRRTYDGVRIAVRDTSDLNLVGQTPASLPTSAPLSAVLESIRADLAVRR